MKRLLSVFISTCLLASLFAGCGQSSDTSAKDTKQTEQKKADETTKSNAKKLSGKIVFASNAFDRIDPVKAIAKEFMDKNPGTEIEVEGIQDVEKNFKVRISAGEVPDVGVVPRSVLKANWSKYYAPIDDLGFTKENLYFYNNGLGPDNKLYNMTCILTYAGIVYNKKAFSDAGITKVPKTLEEFYAACEKLKAKGIVPIASNFKDKWPLNWWSQWDYVYAADGDPDGLNNLAKKDDLLYENGPMMRGLNIIRTLVEKGYVEKDLMSTNFEQFKKDISAGKIAMVYFGTWFPLGAKDMGAQIDDFGMFPVPGAKGVYSGQDWMFGVSKDSKNMDLAKAFFKYAWENGRYSNAVSGLSPIKTVKSEVSFVKELLGYGVPVIEGNAMSDEYTNVFNRAQITFEEMTQEYIITKDPAASIKKYNEKWAAGRKAAGTK